MLSTTNIHWLARPHVLSWLFLLIAMIGVESVGQTPKSAGGRAGRATLGLTALTAIWANVHATFFFAPLICIIYAVGHFARPLIWELDGVPEWRKARWFGVAAVACSAASLLNPYGWELHRHLFRYLTDFDLMARIGEFQSFNFHAEGAFQIAFTLGIATLGAALALGQKQLAHFLLASAL